MKVIAFIEKPDVIKKILKHLGLWHVKRKPQPLVHAKETGLLLSNSLNFEQMRGTFQSGD